MSAGESDSTQVVVIGDSPAMHAVAARLRDRGAEVVAVDEAPGYDRPRPPPRVMPPWMAAAAALGVGFNIPAPRPPRVATPEDAARIERAKARHARIARERGGLSLQAFCVCGHSSMGAGGELCGRLRDLANGGDEAEWIAKARALRAELTKGTTT